MTLKILGDEELAGIDFPNEFLDTMGWKVGDTLKVEPVVNRAGEITHVVIELVDSK